MSWTHEEILAEIAAQYVRSYKDLPFAAYQIQTKFRYEPRAKSGLLRGREFLMKDLYSFHASEEDLFRYYAEVAKAYHRIFERCGLVAYYTLAAGGDFTLSNTHEFQVVSDVGEDTIYVCEKCGYAENDEISKLKDGGECPRCGGKVSVKKAIEVGNIFPLGVKYSEAFGLKFKDETGQEKPVVMGSYGIGVSRLMGVCAEIFHDDHGLVWPSAVAPFDAHLIVLPGADAAASQQVRHRADALYDQLTAAGVEVLYDDRQELTAGEKFAQADVIGIPWRLVVSQKTGDRVEIKKRSDTVPTLVDFHQAAQYCIRT
jgi:prolyl-tRNA synthetase